MPRRVDFAELLAAIVERNGARRRFVAIAGPPGSGKSTLAERLVATINDAEAGAAALLPMDGYHYDDRILVERGLRARKGAPETFDVLGLLYTLDRLRRDSEDDIAVPVFDRDLEISRGSARIIAKAARTLIVEGNYLLLDRQPWSRLRDLFDMTVRVEVAEPILRERLVRRWQGYGLDPAAIEAKLEDNDLPNGRLIVSESRAPDFLIGEA